MHGEAGLLVGWELKGFGVGRGRVNDWTGEGSPDGRSLSLTREMRNAEVRNHRGGIAILRLLLSRGSCSDLPRAHAQGRI